MTKMKNYEKQLLEDFKDDDTFFLLEIKDKNNKVLCKYAYLNGLANPDKIGEMLIKPLKEYEAVDVKEYILSANVTIKPDYNKAVLSLLGGDCLILIPGEKRIVVLDAKNNIFRAVTEPSSEKVLNGPHDGLGENVLINTALIRRHVKNKSFKVSFINLKGLDHNSLAIMYVDEVVDKEVLKMVHKRIDEALNIEAMDTNAIVEEIRDAPLSVFMTTGRSERPDVVAANLLEGKVAICVDGTPVATTMPYTFVENFVTPSDYYLNYFFASANRILRIICFFLSICLPALYVELLSYHIEAIPTKLALSIAASRAGVPFPTFIECLLLLIMFEVLRETGSKIPTILGSSLSVVGAIIIGQATVEARIVSTSVVIVVAASAVCGLVTTRLQSPVFLYKIFLLIVSAVIGIHGFIFGFSIMLIHLMSLESFGKNYVEGLFTFNKHRLGKAYFRLTKRRKTNEEND